MGIFRRKTEGEQLSDLFDRMARLEATVKVVQGEWEDAYERITRMMRRFTKRAERLAIAEEAAQDAPGATISGGPVPDGGVSMDPISAAIHARRARVPTRPDGSNR